MAGEARTYAATWSAGAMANRMAELYLGMTARAAIAA
jgi:hypothetical protein